MRVCTDLCVCDVCVLYMSLQGGVFLLLPHLLFKASYNIYQWFVSPVPQTASVIPSKSVFATGFSGAS